MFENVLLYLPFIVFAGFNFEGASFGPDERFAFITEGNKYIFQILNVQPTDAGEFRCNIAYVDNRQLSTWYTINVLCKDYLIWTEILLDLRIVSTFSCPVPRIIVY